MDVTLPSSMQRFMIRVGLGKKNKVQRQSSQSSSSGCVKDVGRPIGASTAVKSAHDEGTLARRSKSKSVAPESDPSLGARVTLPNSSSTVKSGQNLARTPEPKRTGTFFGTLTNKIRVRAPAPSHTPVAVFDEPKRAEVQSSINSRTFRPQAVQIDLPNDIASRERREEALRSRGLLPPKPPALSALETEKDRRIDADQVNGLSSPGSTHSVAKEIAQSWRSGDSMRPTTDDEPVKMGPEVLIPSNDVSGDGVDTEEADLPKSDGLPKPLPSDARHSPVPSLRAASPAGSNDEKVARRSRPASLRLPGSEGSTGLAQPSVPLSPRSERLSPSSKRSFLQQSHPAEGLAPPFPTQRPASPVSPSSPTEPSLVFSSSSESHSTVFTDNGDSLASPPPNTVPAKGRRANLSPIVVKGSEGGFLSEDTILETTESFPEDNLDPFSGSSNPAPVSLKLDVPAANPPRRKPLAFLRISKKRTPTLGPSSPAETSKPASMMTALQTRARSRSTVSPQDPPSHLSPLNVTMHTDASIIAQVSMIEDDEARRLSELAFA